MAKVPNSIGITGPVAPLDAADLYPTHFSRYGVGGYRAVETVADLDDIPVSYLASGEPLVLIRSTLQLYIYLNEQWQELPLGDGGGGGGGGETRHLIQDENVALLNRPTLSFQGASVTAYDDPDNSRTIVAINIYTFVDKDPDGDDVVKIVDPPVDPTDDWFLDDIDFVDAEFTE